MTSGGGRRRASLTLYADVNELTLVMLEVDSDFEWPRMGPILPSVCALALFAPGCRTPLSVLICLWNRVPVAARESIGISSLTCTV